MPRLLQKPFSEVPLIWFLHCNVLPARLKKYRDAASRTLLTDWQQLLARAQIVVFPSLAFKVRAPLRAFPPAASSRASLDAFRVSSN